MNHTPGPWKYKHSESKNAFNVIGTVLGGNYKIARCPYPVYDFEEAAKTNEQEKNEAEANAKLIAAAPELLNALQKAPILSMYNDSETFIDAYEEWRDNFKTATLQKATL